MSCSADFLVHPLPAPLRGAVHVPGDKSISHRAVLFAAMADGASNLSGVLDSEDVRSTIAAVSALGARVDLALRGDGSLAGTVAGWGEAGPRCPAVPIDCGNSGTTVRLLMGVLAPWDVAVELTGDASLSRRPMRRIVDPLAEMGARFSPAGRETLPLTVVGSRRLRAIAYEAPVASAQLKSAVLLAGAFASGDTVFTEPAPSRNHTELMLPAFGVPVAVRGNVVTVTGPACMRACNVKVPGDPSSAAFLLCAALLKLGSDVVVEDISLNPARTGFIRVLERMGADVSVERRGWEGAEPCGSVRARFTGALRGCEVAAREVASLIDEVPVLALVAAFARGTTVFREVGELRVKETDRLAAIVEGLSLLGVRAWDESDCLFVEGRPDLEVPAGLAFDAHGDHRLAMTWSLPGLCGSVPVAVRGFECVAISYPGFLNDMKRLGSL